ncbi:MAG: hypothetical protein IBX68_11265, partial [Dehalococcoidia bacterium]|nr:hypothetical protein [Dehalococcoidia bacterium]
FIELSGTGMGDILAYGLLLVPLALGLYLAWKKRGEGCVFFACWFIALAVLSLFSRRILMYAAPAAAILAAVGFADLWEWTKSRRPQAFKAGIAVFIPLLLLTSYMPIAAIGSNPLISVNREWQNALAYLRNETPEDSMVMAQWGWGYWILDIADRRPFMDNGYYGYDPGRMRDVGIIYTATEPSVAADLMQARGADYFIFSELDLSFEKTITGWAGLEPGPFTADSLIHRTLGGDFESGGGLRVVYRNSEVVIIGLDAGYP